MHMHTHTHTHTHARTHAHTRMNTHTHTHARVRTQLCKIKYLVYNACPKACIVPRQNHNYYNFADGDSPVLSTALGTSRIPAPSDTYSTAATVGDVKSSFISHLADKYSSHTHTIQHLPSSFIHHTRMPSSLSSFTHQTKTFQSASHENMPLQQTKTFQSPSQLDYQSTPLQSSTLPVITLESSPMSYVHQTTVTMHHTSTSHLKYSLPSSPYHQGTQLSSTYKVTTVSLPLFSNQESTQSLYTHQTIEITSSNQPSPTMSSSTIFTHSPSYSHHQPIPTSLSTEPKGSPDTPPEILPVNAKGEKYKFLLLVKYF